MNILQNEKVSAYSHGALIPVMTAGAIFLAVLAAKNIELQIFLLIYGLSAIILFTASFLYHAKKKSINERTIWSKLDRSAIFVLIAGTATPMFFLYLNKTMMWGVIAALWLLVASGVALIFFVNVPRKISTLIYLLMGSLCIVPIIANISIIPSSIFMLFIAGGISYIAGAIIYAVKKPNLHMGFHEIFHMFVIAGAIFHMAMIIGGATIYLQS